MRLILVCLVMFTSLAEAQETFIKETSSGTFTCGLIGGKWVPGKISGSSFTSYSAQLKKLKKSLLKAKPSKRKSIQKSITSTNKLITRSKGKCSAGPPASPTPAASANFDLSGNVTDQGKLLFGISQNLSANVSSGRSIFQSYCAGCHGGDERINRTMSQYRSATSQSPMLFNSSDLPDSMLANITAYLNRYRLN